MNRQRIKPLALQSKEKCGRKCNLYVTEFREKDPLNATLIRLYRAFPSIRREGAAERLFGGLMRSQRIAPATTLYTAGYAQ
jgi:hypothetical protein